MELSKEQIKRQDLVDNAIFQLIQEVNPSNTDISWNIELIGTIRDAMQTIFVENLALCNKETFYPFLKELD